MKKLLVIINIFLCFSTFGQQVKYAKGIIDTLGSLEFHGRGYVYNGDKLAADYIKKQFIKFNITAFGNNYIQKVTFPMNTFPGNMVVKLNKTQLVPGIDFVVDVSSPSIKGKYKVVWLDDNTLSTPKKIEKFGKIKFENKIVVIDTGFKERKNPNLYKSKGIISCSYKNLIWSVSGAEDRLILPIFEMNKLNFKEKPSKIELDIDASYISNYESQNVAGYIKGLQIPDTFIVFTAHYDHLGEMGKGVIFPGANDNASGTAMVLNIAKYFSTPENRPKYSMAFIFFTGEEAGLLGSKYYSEHPLFPLKSIKVLINLDMVGTGSDGIKMINATVFKTDYDKMVEINKEKGYLKNVASRGEAANSDHYFFYKNGVKAIFIHTLGDEYKEYHNLGDKPDALPLTKYDEVFNLLVDFVKSYNPQ